MIDSVWLLFVVSTGAFAAAQEAPAPQGPQPVSPAVDRKRTHDHPADPQAWVDLGRALLAQHTQSNDNRLEAIRAFRTALSLDKESTDALAGLAGAGFQLGGADGEAIASDALQRLLRIDPLHDGAWEQWLALYRGRGERMRMRAILAAHDTVPQVRFRIAQLLLEDERYGEADTILDDLLSVDSASTCWLTVRAQSAYENGDAVRGASFYRRSLAHAAAGGECLWSQVRAIASASEARSWATVPPEARSKFLEEFWARRNPDLFQATNGRVLEHFRRLRIARREYPLLHPLGMYHRTREGFSLEAAPSIAEQIFYQRCEARAYPHAPVQARDRARTPLPDIASSPAEANGLEEQSKQGISAPGTLYLDPEFVRLISIPQSQDLRDLDTGVTQVSLGESAGLDDRGLTFVRYGAPADIAFGADNVEDHFCQLPNDLQRWTYRGVGTLRFFRPNVLFAGLQGGVRSTGDMVFRPMAAGQFEATSVVLTKDRTSVEAPLAFGFWVAQFHGGDSVTTS